jgi:hypothetical protein
MNTNMKKLTTIVMALLLCTVAFSQSKLDNLTNNPYKKDGHFVGKIEGKDHGFASFEVVFDFWGLLGEPVSMYYFKWTRPQSFGGISTNCYLNTISKDPELGKIYNRITPMPDLKVALKIELRKGTTSIATVYHTANIDLPDPAGKFNTFSLPGSSDWIEMFRPHDYTGRKVDVAGDRSYDNADKLVSLYRARDKDGYAKLILSLFKQADNMVVTLADEKPVTNLKWPEYDFKLLREACTSKPAVPKKTTPASELDELIDRADAAYGKVKDYKDKAALNEAKRLYRQATGNPATAAYAKDQIIRIDKLLNYKEPNITPNLDGIWVRPSGQKIEIQGDKAVLLKISTNKDWVSAVNNKTITINYTLKFRDIRYTGGLTWSCEELWLSTNTDGSQHTVYGKCSIEMDSTRESFKATSYNPNTGMSSVLEYTREK